MRDGWGTRNVEAVLHPTWQVGAVYIPPGMSGQLLRCSAGVVWLPLRVVTCGVLDHYRRNVSAVSLLILCDGTKDSQQTAIAERRIRAPEKMKLGPPDKGKR